MSGVQASGGRSAASVLDALERHRDYSFRRLPSRRVMGEKSALKFVDEVGFHFVGFHFDVGRVRHSLRCAARQAAARHLTSRLAASGEQPLGCGRRSALVRINGRFAVVDVPATPNVPLEISDETSIRQLRER